jgi:hypothetical protein
MLPQFSSNRSDGNDSERGTKIWFMHDADTSQSDSCGTSQTSNNG